MCTVCHTLSHFFPTTMTNLTKSVYFLAAVTAVLHLLALILPGYFWGINWFGYLDNVGFISIVLLMGALLITYQKVNLDQWIPSKKFVLGFALFFGLLYWVLAMVADPYGDAPFFRDLLTNNEPKSFQFHLKLLFFNQTHSSR